MQTCSALLLLELLAWAVCRCTCALAAERCFQKWLSLIVQESACEDCYIAQETSGSQQPRSVTVSVRGEPRQMTVYEVSKMEVPEFAALWTVSFFCCLLHSS